MITLTEIHTQTARSSSRPPLAAWIWWRWAWVFRKWSQSHLDTSRQNLLWKHLSHQLHDIRHLLRLGCHQSMISCRYHGPVPRIWSWCHTILVCLSLRDLSCHGIDHPSIGWSAAPYSSVNGIPLGALVWSWTGLPCRLSWRPDTQDWLCQVLQWLRVQLPGSLAYHLRLSSHSHIPCW